MKSTCEGRRWDEKRVINDIICVAAAAGGGESVMLMRCGKLNRFAAGFCYKGKPVTLTLHNQILVTIVEILHCWQFPSSYDRKNTIIRNQYWQPNSSCSQFRRFEKRHSKTRAWFCFHCIRGKNWSNPHNYNQSIQSQILTSKVSNGHFVVDCKILIWCYTCILLQFTNMITDERWYK